MCHTLTSRLNVVFAVSGCLVFHIFLGCDNIGFLLVILRVVRAVFKVILVLDVFFEVIKDFVLLELVPEKIDVGIIWVCFLQCPPRAIGLEQVFNK